MEKTAMTLVLADVHIKILAPSMPCFEGKNIKNSNFWFFVSAGYFPNHNCTDIVCPRIVPLTIFRVSID